MILLRVYSKYRAVSQTRRFPQDSKRRRNLPDRHRPAASDLGDAAILRGNCNHLGDLWDLGLEAKRRIHQRLVNFVEQQVPVTVQSKSVIVIRPTSLLLIACNPYQRTAPQAGLESTTKRIFNHMHGGG